MRKNRAQKWKHTPIDGQFGGNMIQWGKATLSTQWFWDNGMSQYPNQALPPSTAF